MAYKSEKIIGVMLEDISSDFSKELVKSIVKSVSEVKNVRLAVFPGKYDDPRNRDMLHKYRMVHNSIFELGDRCGVDGMIFHLGSMSMDSGLPLYERCMERFRDVPKVFIGIDDPDVATVNYDNESGIRESIDYLVNIVGIQNLCMLGGREDNKDACLRRDIFIRCLEENHLVFEDRMFVNTDMSSNCVEEAGQLLDLNPDAQAVFCVNDAAAKALYTAMEKRDMLPGRDKMIFAFDNTDMSGELIPALSSIGSYGTTLGEQALGLVLDMINGGEPASALVPTRLYGRESLPYAMYDFNRLEMMNVEPSFVYRLFDDCFYRYNKRERSREEVDLRRLFYEIVSNMLLAIKFRYMSMETFDELSRLIDIFFDNDAVLYTDAAKFLKSLSKLQDAVNETNRSPAAGVQVNRLFGRMKDKAVLALANLVLDEKKDRFFETRSLELFMANVINCTGSREERFERLFRSLDGFCLNNAALYLYDKPFDHSKESYDDFPRSAKLRCVIREGTIHIIAEGRQYCRLDELFIKNELPSKCSGFLTFPVFHKEKIFGLLLCDPVGDIYERGEIVALQIAAAIDINTCPDEE